MYTLAVHKIAACLRKYFPTCTCAPLSMHSVLRVFWLLSAIGLMPGEHITLMTCKSTINLHGYWKDVDLEMQKDYVRLIKSRPLELKCPGLSLILANVNKNDLTAHSRPRWTG